MGYYSLVASCVICGRVFASNPKKVPAYMGEPVCRDCIRRVNNRRREIGMDEWPVDPDAYEPANEFDE